MNISWQNVFRDFEGDGSLRDIYVEPATTADWQRTLDFLRKHSTELQYRLDGQPLPVPISVTEAFSARTHASPLLTFCFGHIHYAAHFFAEDELEFDFVPNDLHDQNDLDSLLDFIQHIGDLLAKPVSVTPENHREEAFLVYHPDSREFRYTPSAFIQSFPRNDGCA